MFQSTNKISENKIFHPYRVFKSLHLKSSKMFCHFEASLVAPLPAGGLLSFFLCITAGGLGLLIREVLGGLGMWGREGGKMGGTCISCPVSGQSHWILENNFSERITFIDEVQLVVIDSNIGEITHWSLSDRLSSVYHPHSNQHVALRVKIATMILRKNT